MLRRELRSLVPELPVAPYAHPPAAAGAGAQDSKEAGAGAGGAAKPAQLEGRAAEEALSRLRSLRKEGERLAEEGGGMDR